MASPLSGLTPEDRTALTNSARDLRDLDEKTLSRANAVVQRAYATARGIADGRLDPLTH
jgi:hypothetical protein